MSELRREMLEALETIEHFGLQPEFSARMECVVPDDRCENDTDRELNGFDAHLATNNNEEGGDKGRMGARETTRMEKVIIGEGSPLHRFHGELHDFAENEDDDRDEEEIGGEEGVEGH